MRELPSLGLGSENKNKSKLQEEGEVSQHRKVDSDLQWQSNMREFPSLGLGVRIEIKVSSKRKERLVSKERLILTFSGEVWYAGVAVPGTGCEYRDKGKLQEEGEVIQQRKVDSDLQWRGQICENYHPWDWGVRIKIKVSSRMKERLVSTERLILTFSGEVWYAGVAVIWG
jgi:hypothetical protein